MRSIKYLHLTNIIIVRDPATSEQDIDDCPGISHEIGMMERLALSNDPHSNPVHSEDCPIEYSEFVAIVICEIVGELDCGNGTR